MPFPSEHQQRVIEHRGKPLIVVAGPGTGKTRTLVERMISLLTEDSNREVVFITFTRTSRRDTEEKLVDTFGREALDQAGLLFPRTSTLHRYAKRFVHQFASHIFRESAFSVPIESRGELSLILGEVISDLDLDLSIDDVNWALRSQRATGEWPVDFPLSPSQRISLAERYELILALYRSLEMEGVVLAAIEIMETGAVDLPQIFLQVDEYQDLNPMDHHFIDLVASHPASEIAIVGDDAQSIYGFRHAHYQGVRTLWESDEWEKVNFPESFRLPAHILNAALALISDAEYIGSEMDRKPSGQTKILALQCTTPDLQVEATARHILDRIGESAEEDPISYGSFLVLCPTGDYAQRAANMLGSDYGVPAYVPPRVDIPDDVWNIVLILRILGNQDPLALRQWLPLLGISDDEILALRDQAIEQGSPFYNTCLTSEDPRINEFKSMLELLEQSLDDSEKFMNVLSSVVGITLPDVIEDVLRPSLEEGGAMPAPSALIQALYEEFGVLEGEDLTESPDQVRVVTMHAAKGLEADYVYCLWMNGRFMPMPGRDLEEERRVLYVALTRAKREVVICFHEEYVGGRQGLVGRGALSPLIREIIDHLRILRMTADLARSATVPWDD